MINFVNANSLHIPLADESVDCVITSPPYWNQRDYQTRSWEGGDPQCNHAEAKLKSRYDYSMASSHMQTPHKIGTDNPKFLDICPTCGATRHDHQLGQETTPDEYVTNLADVCDELFRVLKPTGNFWLNIDDKYINAKGSRRNVPQTIDKGNMRGQPEMKIDLRGKGNYKDTELAGIPWMVALELKRRGWLLRLDIIWHKLNGKPESVRSRMVRSHEYVFHFTKGKGNFFDVEAVEEPAKQVSIDRYLHDNKLITKYKDGAPGQSRPKSMNRPDGLKKMIGRTVRRKRSVWSTPTSNYKGKHFATFPEQLVTPMILAGCPVDGLVLDPFCGSGTVGVVAARYRRRFIGLDLSMKYLLECAVQRTKEIQIDIGV